MVKAIQIPFYNKIQAANPALNPYATIKHQPPRHSELVSESNPLHPQQSNLALIKGLIALNQITAVTFGQSRSNPVKKAGENYIYTKKPDYKGNPKPVKVTVSRKQTKSNPQRVHYFVETSSQDKPIGKLSMASDNEYEILNYKMDLNEDLADYTDSCIVITGLYSFNKEDYKGTGTTLMQYALEESYRQGHEGRMVLNAKNVGNDGTFPTVFYYKMGLRFPDEKRNEDMENYLKTTNSGEYAYLPKSIHAGKMYLPKENIPILLAQSEKTRPLKLREEESNRSYTTILKMPNYAEKQAGQKPQEIQTLIQKNKYEESISCKMTLPSEKEVLGNLRLIEPKEDRKEAIPEKYNDYYDNSLYITWIGTKSSKNLYNKIGSALLKQAVIESIREGHEGRLALYSVRGDMHSDNPSVFYYKMGLRFLDEWRNDMMEEYLEELDYGNKVYIPEPVASGSMYLPEWNIANLLNKK